MCGTTTAWAHTVRGEVVQAVRANLSGTLLCGVAVLGTVWLLTSAAAGHWIVGLPRLKPTLALATVWLLITLIDWAYRVWLR